MIMRPEFSQLTDIIEAADKRTAYSPSDEESHPLLRDLPAPQSVELGKSRGSSCNHKMHPTLSLQQFPSKSPVQMLQQVLLALLEVVGLRQVSKSTAIGESTIQDK